MCTNSKRVFTLLSIGLMILASMACTFFTQSSQRDDQILAVINDNVAASNAEDIEKYMATIHPDSPVYATTESTLDPLFSMYDLSYSVQDLKVLSSTDDEARVSFKLTTKKISGPEFRDNEITGVMILRKDSDGKWKIYNQEIQNIKYLTP